MLKMDESKVLTNRQIVDGLINNSGDRDAAAAAFHGRYSRKIVRWVWRLLGSDDEHEDVVQQVFLNIFNKLPTLQKVECLDSWVDSVAIKTVRFEIKNRKRRRSRFSSRNDTDPETLCDRNSPFKQGHIRRFYEIVGEMPTDDRIVFVLRFIEGYSIEEIASIGNYSPATAKRRLKRAKALFIKNALKDIALVTLAEEYHAD